MKKTFIILCVVFLFSCKKSHSYPVDLDDETLVIPESDYEDVKYEYRTGQTGNYNYNYDVEGYDDYGNYLSDSGIELLSILEVVPNLDLFINLKKHFLAFGINIDFK